MRASEAKAGQFDAPDEDEQERDPSGPELIAGVLRHEPISVAAGEQSGPIRIGTAGAVNEHLGSPSPIAPLTWWDRCEELLGSDGGLDHD